MSVRKRKGSPYWQIKFTLKGVTVQKSAGTTSKEEAEVIEARLKQQVWDELVHGKKPLLTLAEAAQRWVDEKAQEKRSISRDIQRLCYLCETLGHRSLDSLDRKAIIDALKPIEKGNHAPLKPGTINMYLSIVISLQNIAFIDWRLTSQRSRIRRLPLDNKRNRWITPQEADQLEAALPGRYRAPMRFSLLTGLRKMNVLRLRWDWVNLVNRTVTIPAAHYKGKREFTAPLNEDAVKLIRAQIGQNSTYVFGNFAPQGGFEHRQWSKAIDKAGITDFRWHDLRHTWASWHVQLGTSLQELMELGGWKTIDMVLRYAHLAPEQQHSAAERLGTKSLHSLNRQSDEAGATPRMAGLSEP